MGGKGEGWCGSCTRKRDRAACICLHEIERNSERECYVLGDRKQERAMRMRMRYRRQEEMEERDVVSRDESRSGLDYRKDDPDKWNIRQFRKCRGKRSTVAFKRRLTITIR